MMTTSESLSNSPIVEDDANDPSIATAVYERMRPRWEKCRDCFMGTEAIRAGTTTYLPQYEAESDERYEVRSQLAAFYNGYSRTVLASVGMLLEEEPTLGEDMPPDLVELWENIDAAGTHGAVFARRLATAGIIDGYAGILVEHSRSPAPGQLSGDEEKRLGLRPYFLLFRAHDVMRAIYESVNGARVLTLLVLREVVRRRDGLFGTKTVVQYRVYTNEKGVISYQLWSALDSSSRPSKTEGPTTVPNLTAIPWAPFIAGEEVPGSPGEYKPPLLDLADLNIQYHNTLTNILSLQSLAFVPTPVRIGATPDAQGNYPTLVLGPGNTIEAPITEGVAEPVYWLSPDVSVLEPGDRTLQATKADMATMGAAFLAVETRAAETAEGKRIDSAAQRATLATVARALKDCLETAFGFMAAYRKLQGGSVTLNEDFTGVGIDPQYLTVLVQAYQQDALSLEELRHVIHTGQLPEDFDAADVVELLANQAAKEKLREEENERRAAELGTRQVA